MFAKKEYNRGEALCIVTTQDKVSKNSYKEWVEKHDNEKKQEYELRNYCARK